MCVGWEGTWAGPRDGRRLGRYPTVSEVCDSLVFGSREPAVLDSIDSEAITRQLTSELDLPMCNSLVDFVRHLVRDSQEPARLAARADGQLASYKEWRSCRRSSASGCHRQEPCRKGDSRGREV